MKSYMIQTMTLILGLGLMLGTVLERNAQASRFDEVSALKVQQLGQFRGQTLSAFYVLGQKPFLTAGANKIDVDKVKLVKSQVITQDTQIFEAAQIEKENFRGSYNMIVFVISVQPNPIWVNADGSIPEGQTISGAIDRRQFTLVNVVNKSDVDAQNPFVWSMH